MTPPREHGIRVLHLFDAYLNIYADRGNIMVLSRRCEWRGLTCEVSGLGLDDNLDPDAWDLIYVGGGQDRDQRMIAERLAGRVGARIREAAASGTAILAVCGGYQLLGDSYLDVSGVTQPGVGLLGLHTVAGQDRLIGNIAIEALLPAIEEVGLPDQLAMIVGFENHAGRTILDTGSTAFGQVLAGHGNDGTGKFEGCMHERTIGTYLHGPLLPRNPELADWLICAALAHRYGSAAPPLEPLDDSLGARARTVAIARARAEHPRRGRRR